MRNCSYNIPDPDGQVCSCDIGVGGWTITKDRSGQVKFLPPFSKPEIRVVVHRRDIIQTNNAIFFMMSFTLKVLTLIILLFLCFSDLRILYRRFLLPGEHHVPLPREYGFFRRIWHYLFVRNVWGWFRRSIWHTVTEILGRVVRNAMAGIMQRQWVHRIGIVLCGLFFVRTTYESVMTAILVN